MKIDSSVILSFLLKMISDLCLGKISPFNKTPVLTALGPFYYYNNIHIKECHVLIMKFIKELEGRLYYYDIQRVPSGEYTLEFFYTIKGSSIKYYKRSPIGNNNFTAFSLLRPGVTAIKNDLKSLGYPSILITYADKDTISAYDLILKSIGYKFLKESNNIRIYGGDSSDQSSGQETSC